MKPALYRRKFSTILSFHTVLPILVYGHTVTFCVRAFQRYTKAGGDICSSTERNGRHECCQRELLAAGLNARVSMGDRSKDRLSNARRCPDPMGPNVMSAQSPVRPSSLPHFIGIVSTYPCAMQV